nr:hypothetical protein CFP56_14731 [Quercus suber]
MEGPMNEITKWTMPGPIVLLEKGRHIISNEPSSALVTYALSLCAFVHYIEVRWGRFFRRMLPLGGGSLKVAGGIRIPWQETAVRKKKKARGIFQASAPIGNIVRLAQILILAAWSCPKV